MNTPDIHMKKNQMIYEQVHKAPFMENPVVLVECEKPLFLRELIVFLTYTCFPWVIRIQLFIK